ncbi:MAG: DALR anticodon-binding domain-containing protein, partial [Nanoarchaeota archaeon]
AILKVSPDKNVCFNWEQAMSFEGETGPYLQYAHARICSLLRKYGKKVPKKADLSLLSAEPEIALLKTLSDFPSAVEGAEKKPYLLATYAFSLAKQFSDFYHAEQVLKADDRLRDARLILVDAVRQILSTALNLLGMDAPEQM